MVTREASRERFFIQITACPHYVDLIGTRCACNAIDISFSGIKMRCADFIPPGCRLKVWFNIGLRAGRYLLHGEVRWIRQLQHSARDYQMGVFLRTGTGANATTDIEAWQVVHWL